MNRRGYCQEYLPGFPCRILHRISRENAGGFSSLNIADIFGSEIVCRDASHFTRRQTGWHRGHRVPTWKPSGVRRHRWGSVCRTVARCLYDLGVDAEARAGRVAVTSRVPISHSNSSISSCSRAYRVASGYAASLQPRLSSRSRSSAALRALFTMLPSAVHSSGTLASAGCMTTSRT